MFLVRSRIPVFHSSGYTSVDMHNRIGLGICGSMARWLPAALWLLVPVLGVAAGDERGDFERLAAGEVLAQDIHEDKAGGAARVTALFHADADAIWNVIGYCENEFVYVRGLELCEVVLPGLQVMQKHHRVNNNWYTPTIDFVFEARRESPVHGTFKLVEGNLKVLEGQWLFQPAPGGEGLVVSHDIRLKSRFPAPRWLVRRVLKNDLPDMLACIRGMARGSGSEALQAGDLARCPGNVPGAGN